MNAPSQPRIFGDPNRPGFELHWWRNFRSPGTPFDEAKMFPLIHKHRAEALPAGPLQKRMASREVQRQVIKGAHDAFMHRTDHDATDAQVQLRYDMRDYLSLCAKLFELDDPEPKSWVEALAVKVFDFVFPHRRRAREQATADLRVEQWMAKYILINFLILAEMYAEATGHRPTIQ